MTRAISACIVLGVCVLQYNIPKWRNQISQVTSQVKLNQKHTHTHHTHHEMTKRSIEDISSVLPDKNDPTFTAMAMLLEHVQELQGTIDKLTSGPPQDVRSSAAEALEDAVKFMFGRVQKFDDNSGLMGFQVIAQYRKDDQMAHIEISRTCVPERYFHDVVADYDYENVISAAWRNDQCTKCNSIDCFRSGFELNGSQINEMTSTNRYPYTVYWKNTAEFMDIGLKRMIEGKNGWNIVRIGYRATDDEMTEDNFSISWKWKSPNSLCDSNNKILYSDIDYE